MLLRILYINLFLFFFSMNNYGQYKDVIRDTLIIQKQDSIKKNNIFRRIYKYFQEANKPKEEKKFDFSIIGGPHFASDTKLGLGLVASGLYRVDYTDKSLSPSNVSFYGDVTTTGYYLLGVNGNTLFPKEKYRLDFDLYFFSFPSKYWGIGYKNGSQEAHYTTYDRKEVQWKINFLTKIAPNTFVGITGLYRHVNGKHFKDIAFLEGEKSNISTFGGGILISYDSRDFIPNPYTGIYAKVEQTFYPSFLGNKYSFRRTDIILRHYSPLWKGAILASDLEGILNYGDTPWSMVAQLGGAYQMRGYYEGQYRDENLIQTQFELRQKIYNRHGIAVWVGAGNVFPKFSRFKWDETLPSYGIGYRWEFKKRVNIRLDYGFGKKQSAFYFNINEAF